MDGVGKIVTFDWHRLWIIISTYYKDRSYSRAEFKQRRKRKRRKKQSLGSRQLQEQRGGIDLMCVCCPSKTGWIYPGLARVRVVSSIVFS